ncbi:MAG: hypothetical protein IH936_03615 [Acidobacteria bacterium]|nr:hypothetical protein [Acidobacteriota bacterium]
MNRARCFSWVAALGVILTMGSIVAHAVPLPRVLNHNFDVDAISATVCEDGAIFTGEATGASALNLLMTSQVFTGGGTLMATGNTHTFTAVGEIFTFSVVYPIGTFNVGDPVQLSVTDNPPTIFGVEGDVATATVAACPIPVPTIPGGGLLLLALMLLAGGAVLLARRSRGSLARPAHGLWIGFLLFVAVAAAPIAATVASPPGFSKVFMPDTIGPGSTSMLIFTINNSGSVYPVDMLAFSDMLPGGMTLAEPAFVSNTCGGTVTALDGGGTITLTDGMVGKEEICEIVVNVTAADTEGNPYTNTTGALTSDAGSICIP